MFKKDDNKKMILEAQNMYNIHVSSNKILWMLFIYCYIDLGFKRFIYHQLYLKIECILYIYFLIKSFHSKSNISKKLF